MKRGAPTVMTRGATTALIALLGGFVTMSGSALHAAEPASEGLPLQIVSAPIALTVAGHPAVLRVVRARRAPPEAVDAVASIWRAGQAVVRRDDEGPWRNVSRFDRDGIETLQLRAAAGGGSEGYLVGWRFDAARDAGSVAHRLLPPFAKTLSDVVSRDAAAGRTIVAWAPGSVDDTDRAVLRNATSLGLRQRTEGRRAGGAPAHERARFFSADGAELALTLHREGSGTALVIHLMEANR